MLHGDNCRLSHFRDTELKGKNGRRAQMRARSQGQTDEKFEGESGLGRGGGAEVRRDTLEEK